MSYANYTSQTLRASAVTAGASEQDSDVTLPDSVSEFWVVVNKTAEAAADNLLTVRLQSKVAAVYFDLSWDSISTTTALATAADTAANVTRTPNILDADSTAPTFSVLAHYKSVPSRIIRVASITSGTGPTHTFSVICYYMQNQF